MTVLIKAAVTIVPATMAMTYMMRLSTTGKTIGPPCGAWSPTPPSDATTAAVMEPTIIHGMTRSGSAAAKGIAPSVIPIIPIATAAMPASFSSSLQSLRWIIVATPRPSGGVQIAAAQIPITP